jgi:NADH-quinone oxidoreductase subunit G
MATLYVDGKPYPVDPEQNVLQNVLTLGFDLEFFCWHPAMGSVGACRQCAVKTFRDEHDAQGKIVMACMTPAADGTRISVDDPEAKAFRASVIEGLMQPHPHDCPVCDEGGECHLQDMTLMTGHDYRRYRFEKRTYRNQYLGPFLNHEMNRCIQCYRCVRFYHDYAGGDDLHAFHLRNTVYFGRARDGVLESPFAGNLAEVCPTGVFTDKTLARHYTRRWDLQSAPSVCVHCGVGCNTHPGERYGLLRRIYNRYNEEVNGFFLCDRGRFGYEFVNSPQRIREPILRREGKTLRIQRDEAARILGDLIRNGRAIGIGSPRASLEANFALRTAVGPDRFFIGLADRQHRLVAAILDILRNGPARTPSLREIEQSDAVFILGEDVTNVAARMALSLRQSVRQQPLAAAAEMKIPLWHDTAVRDATRGLRGPLFIAAPADTGLDDVATECIRALPDELARLGFAVAHAIDPRSPGVADLPKPLLPQVDRIARALKEARRPLVVSGMSANSEGVIQAAANIAWALCRTGAEAALSFTVPECNTLGAGLMGGRPLGEAFQMIRQGGAETVLILENDLTRRADAPSVTAFLEGASHRVLLDTLANPTAALSELVLPAGSFAEGDGTLVSSEGRAQRFFQIFSPNTEGDGIEESWRWLRDGMIAAGRKEMEGWFGLDDVISAMTRALPALAPVADAAPSASFRMAGQKIPRESIRFSGRTAIWANRTVHEPAPPDDPDSPLSFSMEGYAGPPPPSLVPLYWTPRWDSNQQAIIKLRSERGEHAQVGGLRGGASGVRLIEPNRSAPHSYFSTIPPPFRPRAEEWLLIPLYHLFGSEELSRAAPAILERAPLPYLLLHPEEARRLQVGPGEEVAVRLGGRIYRLPARVGEEIQKGAAGIPVGLPPFVGIDLPAWGRLEKPGVEKQRRIV